MGAQTQSLAGGLGLPWEEAHGYNNRHCVCNIPPESVTNELLSNSNYNKQI